MSKAKAPHSALSYSKWDNIDSSDDEEREAKKKGPIDNVLEHNKSSTQRELDEKDAKYFLDSMRKYCGKYRKEAALAEKHWQVVANFIGVCSPGKEKTNVHRYNDICMFATRYGDILLKPEIADSMCELHCAIQAASKNLKDDNDPHILDMERLMHAINALEACRVNEKAVMSFYEMIAQPSSSGRAYKLTKKYYEMEFGKQALMRHIFPDKFASGIFKEHEQDYADLIVDGGAPPPGSSRVREKEPDMFWHVDQDDMVMLAMICFTFALLIGLVLFAVYAIDWETLPPPSFLGAKPFGDKAPWAKGGAWRSSSGEIDVGKLEQETGKGEL